MPIRHLGRYVLTKFWRNLMCVHFACWFDMEWPFYYCSLLYLFKETSTIASTLERSEEHHWPARLYASRTTLPNLLRIERRGNCFLSCLFNSFGTIVLSFERSKTSQVFLALLVHHALSSTEVCGLQVRLYLRMLTYFKSSNCARNRPRASCKLKNTKEQA